MKLTRKNLREICTKHPFPYEMVKNVYDILLANVTEDKIVTQQDFELHLAWMASNNIKNLDEYHEMVSNFKKLNEEAVSNTRLTDNEMRKKLGYNNTEWKKVRELDRAMAGELKKLIIEFVAVNIANEVILDELAENASFKKLDVIWRNFARTYLIPNYPRAKNDPAIIAKIIGLFQAKLREALKN